MCSKYRDKILCKVLFLETFRIKVAMHHSRMVLERFQMVLALHSSELFQAPHAELSPLVCCSMKAQIHFLSPLNSL